MGAEIQKSPVVFEELPTPRPVPELNFPEWASPSHPDVQYLNLANYILENGVKRGDRTGVGTLSVFGPQMRFDLSEGFPALTSKKVFTKSLTYELLWLLKGDTNIDFLNENGVHIWDEWADENGDLGPVYGKQWRSWEGPEKTIDQIAQVESDLKKNPYSRRHIVSAWKVDEIDKMALPPCHALFQFYVADKKLSCQLYQRSGDFFLGVPFNIASYAMLTNMMAQSIDLEPGEFVHTLGDAHIYLNHIDKFHKQLERASDIRKSPKLKLNTNIDSVLDYNYEDISIEDYNPHPYIKAPIAV